MRYFYSLGEEFSGVREGNTFVQVHREGDRLVQVHKQMLPTEFSSNSVPSDLAALFFLTSSNSGKQTQNKLHILLSKAVLRGNTQHRHTCVSMYNKIICVSSKLPGCSHAASIITSREDLDSVSPGNHRGILQFEGLRVRQRKGL